MILPVKYPLITYKPQIANVLAILGASGDTYEWILNHYFHIYVDAEWNFDFWDKELFYEDSVCLSS